MRLVYNNNYNEKLKNTNVIFGNKNQELSPASFHIQALHIQQGVRLYKEVALT